MKHTFLCIITWIASTLGARFEDYVKQAIKATEIVIRPELVHEAAPNNDQHSLNIAHLCNITLAPEKTKIFSWNNIIILITHNLTEQSDQCFTLSNDHIELFFTHSRIIVTHSTFKLWQYQVREILDAGFESMSNQFSGRQLNGLIFCYTPHNTLILENHWVLNDFPLTVESLENGKISVMIGSQLDKFGAYFSMVIDPNPQGIVV